MKVVFADSFFKSFKRMINRETRIHWKIWDFVRYSVPNFFRNVWQFRKELWSHRNWDSAYSLRMLNRSIELLADSIEKYGTEIDGPRLKKVAAMRRAVELMRNFTEDAYISIAEKRLGREIDVSYLFDEEPAEISAANSEIFNLAQEIEAAEWIELFKILQGQDHAEYIKFHGSLSKEELAKRDAWYEWFNGTGMKHWWN